MRRSLSPGLRRPATKSSTRARKTPALEASAMPSPSMLIRGCLVKEVPYNRRFTMESRSPCRRRARMLESCRRAQAIHLASSTFFSSAGNCSRYSSRIGLTLA